jgi:hypothetical protein
MHPLLELENDLIQARVKRMPDEVVAGDHGVLAAVQAQQLEFDANTARRAPLISIRDTIDATTAKIEGLTQQVRDINSARPALAVAIAKGEQSDSDDRQAQASRHDMQRQIDLLDRAVVGLTDEVQLGERHARARFDHDRLREAVATAVIRAKITLAKNQ